MKMRMVGVPHRLFWPLVCTVALLLGYVMLKMYYNWVITLDPKACPFHKLSKWVMSNLPHSAENFECSAQDSMEVIPPHFPQLLQEFLRLRHCRSFPTLLTPSPCEDDLYLLLAIKSTAVQVERRAALRDTWGRAGLIQGRRVKLIFLMGRSLDQVQSQNLQPLLEWENNNYGDILQWDFVDIFFNLTRKEIHFLKWCSHMCSSAQFVFKGDDDVFVNTENLIEFLSAHKADNHLFAGYIHPHAFPDRNKNIKYYIPVEMYPEGKPYPPFPSGGGYLMSRQTVFGLDVAAQKVDLFPLDDVFLGMCLHEMGISLTHHRGFLTFGFSQGLKHFDPCVYRDIMLVHKLNPTELRVMWTLMQDKNLPCEKSWQTL